MKRAFTLIELLIVVAIIAILAAIAVPNFLEAQTRAKISRAQNDLRAITTAVEAFHVDNAKYPLCEGTDLDGGKGFSYITSPIAYIVGTNVREIFPGKGPGKIYPFYSYAALSKDGIMDGVNASGGSAHWFFLFSHGPDLVQNDFKNVLMSDDFPAFMGTVYDPTNGILSTGNVYRSGGSIEGAGTRAGLWAASAKR